MRGPNRKITGISRGLRTRQTDAETKLWRHLRSRGIAGCKFVRQEPIGSYICDFVCRERKFIIEVDGGQHADSESDRVRDQSLMTMGYRVLRFWNNDVLGNCEGVMQIIHASLADGKPLTPTLSP